MAEPAPPGSRAMGIALPGLARMAEVTRAISEAAAKAPPPDPGPPLVLGPWELPAPAGGSPVTLANRVVMAPVPTGTALPDGSPGAEAHAWYVARARGGVGLIVIEATLVSRAASPDPACRPVLADEEGAGAFASLAHEVNVAGSVPALSLDHPDPRPLAAWTAWEIRQAVEDFVLAASRARDAGFAAVHLSLDGAGFLGRTLLREKNRRADRYGRGPSGRRRLAMEVVAAVAAVGLPVIVRVPCPAGATGTPAAGEAATLAGAAVAAGATAIEVAPGPRHDSPTLPMVAGNGEAVLATPAGSIAAGVGVPVIASGRIVSALGAEAALRTPGIAAVALGRALVADPAWVAKVRAGIEAEIVPCIGCMACHDRSGGPRIGCVTNGDAGRESELHAPAGRSRRILVHGSGLPGLEFARVAASRGHDVTVVPDAMPLGGITGLRAGVPGNAEYGRAALAAIDRLRDLGVAVAGAAPSWVDLVVDARAPVPRPVEWGTGRNVLRAGDVLGRDLHQMYGIGRRVAVCGPGALAAEVALFLAGWGRRPTVIVPGDRGDPFPDVHPMHAGRLLERLEGYKCDLVTGATPLRWLEARDRKCRLEVRRDEMVKTLGPFQTAVDCTGWPLPSSGGEAVDGEALTLGDAGTAAELRRLVRAANEAARST